MQRLIIQDRALRIAASTASVKGEDHHVGGSCRARLAGRQRTADRQEAGVNDPSAQRPGALPLPTGPPCDRALTITSGSPQASATTGIDSSPATMSGQDQGPARGVSVHFEVADATKLEGRRIGSTRSRQRLLPRVLRGRNPSSNNYRRGGGSRNRVQRFIFEFGRDNING